VGAPPSARLCFCAEGGILRVNQPEHYDSLICPQYIAYAHRGEIGKYRSAVELKTDMGLFRILRPITVNARQCTQAGTIATDLGFANVKPGDWIISGEDGESYILDNEFFQRTFAPIEEQPEEQPLACESPGTPDPIYLRSRTSHPHPFQPIAAPRVPGRRRHHPRSGRRPSLPTH
jgi:hypothetical protein